MTTCLYFTVAFLTIIVFVGGLFAAFKAGESSGIARYGHKEESDERTENNE